MRNNQIRSSLFKMLNLSTALENYIIKKKIYNISGTSLCGAGRCGLRIENILSGVGGAKFCRLSFYPPRTRLNPSQLAPLSSL
uniref:Uncharacterized protein n=1 Tax=Solanum lycopersicum TaxID=4081 RepID=A0A3Q7HN30_SOLLC